MSAAARELLKKQMIGKFRVDSIVIHSLELTRDETSGFSVGLEDDSDWFRWRVVFEGPPDTIYFGGLFTALLRFPEDFPNSPPEMKFETSMWHPNSKPRHFHFSPFSVYPDGRVCISILHPPGTDRFNDQERAEERWRPILGVESILLSVISMLADPNLASPANIDAAVQMKNEPDAYKKRVRLLVRKSIEG